ncbi:2-hydroxychromene-2-carboxylate isomerase [Pseudolysobacter antarcticus]|uniref:2-hydroxychromene-2-carboxylate isomerase n=1 Tax=Pseudolysobacter antarcticus TaxID=2511995 RepID=A0A411HFD9_9GAMM|nr:2-hydroxychromene-2-carboxylate isomerase [Pseudolysobacter antarcticus]QBB69191.1 2-hydroxychromene-2-carboxylate isomerase [Pseudolysobacter antarcticus]
MQKARWYFDFVSPFCYLQLKQIERLRVVLPIIPIPILFGAVLSHHGNIGPAEIPGKRLHTYRMVQWQAKRSGIELRFPPAHPFNPISALRLSIALDNRWDAIRAIFDHLWRDGKIGDSASALVDVAARFDCHDVAAAIDSPAVKSTLRANTETAIAAGVFGVPTVAIGDTLFWGNDATAMLEDFLVNPQLFDSEEMRRIETLPVGIERKR